MYGFLHQSGGGVFDGFILGLLNDVFTVAQSTFHQIGTRKVANTAEHYGSIK
jgi:hypothetical protein